MHCQILLPADLSAGVQPVYAVSKPTSLGQWCRGAACLCSVGTYLGGTVGQVCSLVKRCQNLSLWDCGQGWSLFMRCQNLPPRTVRQWCNLFMWCQYVPPGDWWIGVQPVYMVSVPTSWGLLGSNAACLCCVRTYLQGIVGQQCSLFMPCQNLPPGYWGAETACLYGVTTYPSGTVGQRSSVFKWTVGLGCNLVMWCRHQPLRTGGRGVACLCSVGTYLPRTVRQGCCLFMWWQNLPPGDLGQGRSLIMQCRNLPLRQGVQMTYSI